MTGTPLPGFTLDAVVVVGRVVVVVGAVFVAVFVAARVVGVSVVGVAVVVVVGRVVVVAAVVGGIVADGAAAALVVGVTPREERGRLELVAVAESTVLVDWCGAPFPLGPIVNAKAVTSATAPTVAPMIVTFLRLSGSASAGDSLAIDAGGTGSEVLMAGSDASARNGESDIEGAACTPSPPAISPGSRALWSYDSKPSCATGSAVSCPAI